MKDIVKNILLAVFIATEITITPLYGDQDDIILRKITQQVNKGNFEDASKMVTIIKNAAKRQQALNLITQKRLAQTPSKAQALVETVSKIETATKKVEKPQIDPKDLKLLANNFGRGVEKSELNKALSGQNKEVRKIFSQAAEVAKTPTQKPISAPISTAVTRKTASSTVAKKDIPQVVQPVPAAADKQVAQTISTPEHSSEPLKGTGLASVPKKVTPTVEETKVAIPAASTSRQDTLRTTPESASSPQKAIISAPTPKAPAAEDVPLPPPTPERYSLKPLKINKRMVKPAARAIASPDISDIVAKAKELRRKREAREGTIDQPNPEPIRTASTPIAVAVAKKDEKNPAAPVVLPGLGEALAGRENLKRTGKLPSAVASTSASELAAGRPNPGVTVESPRTIHPEPESIPAADAAAIETEVILAEESALPRKDSDIDGELLDPELFASSLPDSAKTAAIPQPPAPPPPPAPHAEQPRNPAPAKKTSTPSSAAAAVPTAGFLDELKKRKDDPMAGLRTRETSLKEKIQPEETEAQEQQRKLKKTETRRAEEVQPEETEAQKKLKELHRAESQIEPKDVLGTLEAEGGIFASLANMIKTTPQDESLSDDDDDDEWDDDDDDVVVFAAAAPDSAQPTSEAKPTVTAQELSKRELVEKRRQDTIQNFLKLLKDIHTQWPIKTPEKIDDDLKTKDYYNRFLEDAVCSFSNWYGDRLEQGIVYDILKYDWKELLIESSVKSKNRYRALEQSCMYFSLWKGFIDNVADPMSQIKKALASYCNFDEHGAWTFTDEGERELSILLSIIQDMSIDSRHMTFSKLVPEILSKIPEDVKAQKRISESKVKDALIYMLYSVESELVRSGDQERLEDFIMDCQLAFNRDLFQEKFKEHYKNSYQRFLKEPETLKKDVVDDLAHEIIAGRRFEEGELLNKLCAQNSDELDYRFRYLLGDDIKNVKADLGQYSGSLFNLLEIIITTDYRIRKLFYAYIKKYGQEELKKLKTPDRTKKEILKERRAVIEEDSDQASTTKDRSEIGKLNIEKWRKILEPYKGVHQLPDTTSHPKPKRGGRLDSSKGIAIEGIFSRRQPPTAPTDLSSALN